MHDAQPIYSLVWRFIVMSSLALSLSNCTIDKQDEHTATASKLGAADGRWVVINYWATWCKPCIDEMPELNRFAQQNKATVRVYAVNFDKLSGEELSKAVSKLDIRLLLLLDDPADQLDYPSPQVLPTTVILTPALKLHKILTGPQTSTSLKTNTTAGMTIKSTAASAGNGNE